MQTLHFSATINAPVQKVWDTMLADASYRQWTAPFNPHGSYFEGSWVQGSEIRFYGPDEKGNIGGMVSRIVENRPLEFISIEHYGMINNGVVDTTSPQVQDWAGAHENYTFRAVGENQTELTIDIDVADVKEYTDMFNESWPQALEILKNLSEGKPVPKTDA